MGQEADKKRRTVFILSVPGGAMLGILPAVALARFEQLTETPALDLFQVVDGVSTGAIAAAGLNIRDPDDHSKVKFSAHDIAEMYCRHGPRFFPEIPRRMEKLTLSEAMRRVEDVIDPLRLDEKTIEDLQKLFKKLDDKLLAKSTPQIKQLAASLHNISTSRWITDKGKKKALDICEQLKAADNDLTDIVVSIGELTFTRTASKLLRRVFTDAALGGMNLVHKFWAHDYKFDPKVPEAVFQDLYKDRRMSDCARSTYISAYDVKENRIWTFFCRKNDFFDPNPDAPAVVSRENAKLWDAVMASVANPFAFPPHLAENGVVYSDKGLIHTPLNCVLDVIKHKPDDADVKLVFLDTGRYLSHKKDGALLRDEYDRHGIVGNLLEGGEMMELKGYAMSAARNVLRKYLGKENFYELVPRLAPTPDEDINDMPSRNSLNASPENMRRILDRAFRFIDEEDAQIRTIARMLVDNLHNLGQMDEAKYQRVMKNIDNPPPDDLETFRRSFDYIEEKLCPAPAPNQPPSLLPRRRPNDRTGGGPCPL